MSAHRENAWVSAEVVPPEDRYRLGWVVLGIFGVALITTGLFAVFTAFGDEPPTLSDLVAALITPTAALAGSVVTYYFTRPGAN